MGFTPDMLARKVPTSMTDLYSRPRGNTVAYIQNQEDATYFEHHCRPFTEARSGSNEVLTKTREWGQGHGVPPRDEYFSAAAGVGGKRDELGTGLGRRVRKKLSGRPDCIGFGDLSRTGSMETSTIRKDESQASFV